MTIRRLDAASLLEAASLVVPEDAATGDDITVNDVWEYLAHDEWEVALALLEELGGDTDSLPLGFWESLATAAEQARLERSAAWCRWRCREARQGMIIRADLTLTPADEGRRRAPFPGAGVLRPLWNIGCRTATGEPDLRVAALWAEFVPFVDPGGQASVRLAPLTPSQWQHLRPGQVITMHEDRTVAGTAVVRSLRPLTCDVLQDTADA
ncbi:hypothetical protein ABZV77_10410 [Streptomyces sp. NPDC004732]|uniref:hypothetical protein n=1 Tax=Streptomyces sp. NPDC004732 TaxID=3154290 RepID=UPI0033B4E4E4